MKYTIEKTMSIAGAGWKVFENGKFITVLESEKAAERFIKEWIKFNA